MLLSADSCLTGLVFASDMLGMGVFALQNDLKHIQFRDSFCIFRCYVGVVSCTAFNGSFLLQAVYRYFIVVYPHFLFWQSIRFQVLLICLTWIFSYLWPIALLFTGDIIYNVDNQIYQLFICRVVPL
ncbi:unnamed protein product [Rotaria magnacalcarata]|uniref:G-protein coupled receptors family 1 profile domain-containing protein n=1 Tax=Rotaria magnacalcarata TaxID=392030 RepID=A0A815Z780_9BILA|nr:unnamed protein product [Rotaria magnacalcarata]